MGDIFRPTDSDMLQELKDMQKKTGSVVDGILGTQTLYNWWKTMCPEHVSYPHSRKIFNGIVIYTKDIKIDYSQNKRATKDIASSISGVFQWDSKAISVLMQGGQVFCNSACHTWLGKPETIIYKTKHGVINAIRAISIPQALLADIEWAIGGLGLHNYNPSAEGFTGAYSDVLRSTGHTGIGLSLIHI